MRSTSTIAVGILESVAIISDANGVDRTCFASGVDVDDGEDKKVDGGGSDEVKSGIYKL